MNKFDKQLLAILIVSIIIGLFGIGGWDTFLSNVYLNFIAILIFASIFNMNEYFTRENQPTLTIKVEDINSLRNLK